MPQAICALISHGIHSENVIENPVKITIEESEN